LTLEEELLLLARQRENTAVSHLADIELAPPDSLRRQIRADLHRQVDRGRVKRPNERIPHLTTVVGGVNELECRELEFASGTRLEFLIRFEESQRGWLMKQFQFHIFLAHSRRIKMVRIHLNPESSHDPLTVPRCHLHIDDSAAHIPFPIMNPRLILHVICEHIEPDFGS
jgi:hypothetical protein